MNMIELKLIVYKKKYHVNEKGIKSGPHENLFYPFATTTLKTKPSVDILQQEHVNRPPSLQFVTYIN